MQGLSIGRKNNNVNFINFPKRYISILKKAALNTLKSEKIEKYQINFVIVSNKEIRSLNAKHRKIKRVTDVISFLLIPKIFVGDIYVSKERSQKQAKKYGNTWQQELAYLIIHGVLHLCGYTDYDVANRDKMFNRQDEIFKFLFYNG
ncbi:MAG: rRNA maturation RNase YbeY [Endomicrobium sp.]|jgi:probable rRNA maturation factor|nr:rRNA maturation RNase YbeY [Endomicrobium sp.]